MVVSLIWASVGTWLYHILNKTACTKSWLDQQKISNLFSIINMPGHKTDYIVQAHSLKNNWVNKLCVCDMKLF